MRTRPTTFNNGLDGIIFRGILRGMSSTTKPAADRLAIVSLTIPESLLASVDALTAAQDMTRSQYFRQLARRDLAKVRRKSPSPTQTTTEAAA